MRTRIFVPVVALIATLALSQPAQAHFIWAVFSQGQVRFALLENPAEKADPRFAHYVEHLIPSFSPDRGTALAQSTVGVKERDGQLYLLRYTAKAAARLESAGVATKDAPTELLAQRNRERLVATVLQDGWRAPGVAVTVHWPGTDRTETATTDLRGQVTFAWPQSLAPGLVGLRAKVVEKVAGVHADKPYPQTYTWTTLTFPVVGTLSQQLRAAFRENHETIAGATFNKTLFSGQLTRTQAELHLQQRALIHTELDRILTHAAPSTPLPYGPDQQALLPLLRADLRALGLPWPTEAQARPLTQAFLNALRASEAQGPYFALGVFHVYYGGTTNGGRLIGQKLAPTLGFSPTYYAQSDGYRNYLRVVDKISAPDAQAELLRGGQAAYHYLLASMNEKVFAPKAP